VVVKIPTITTAYTSAPDIHVFDEVNLWAEVKTNCPGYPLSGTVDFYVTSGGEPTTLDYIESAEAFVIPPDETGYGTTLRAVLPYSWPAEIGYGEWTVWAVFNPSAESDEYIESKDDTPIKVYQKEAVPFDATAGFYTGQILAWTTGPNSSTGTVTLAAMLMDSGESSGDIRAAKVTFCQQIGTEWVPIPSAKDLPVGLKDMTDGTIGFASADLQINIPKNEEATSIVVGVKISGQYYNDPDETATIVTVSKPVAGGAIFGAGKVLNNENSDGLIKGADHYKTGFSYDVHFNKKQINPQGKMTIIIQSWYDRNGILDGAEKPHVYIVNSNAINLFVVGPQVDGDGSVLSGNQAIFDAKANISELVNGVIEMVDGNSPLHVTMTNNTSDGQPDQIGVTYYRNDGGLWFSSNWDISIPGTVETAIADGEIVVEGTVVNTVKGPQNKSASIEVASEAETSSLLVYPNPFTDRLLFEFSSPVTAEARLEVYDATGRLVKVVFDQAVEGGVNYNAEFRPNSNMSNMYFYRLTLGEETYNGKVLYRK
jgi:hypothetical protein